MKHVYTYFVVETFTFELQQKPLYQSQQPEPDMATNS